MSLIKTSELTGLLDKVFKETGRLRAGNNLQYHCPFCHHAKRKMEFCLDSPFVWHCWVCDVKGRGGYSLLKKLKSPRSLIDELEKIVGKFQPKTNVDFFAKPLISFNSPKVEAKVELDLPDGFTSLSNNNGTVDYRRAINYARKRKLSDCDILKYNIGYCATGEYQHRLVFPSYDNENRLNFFSTRSYFDDTFLKYINSKVSKDIIGFENLINFDYPIYLVEGALDAIALKRNAIPLFGKTLSNKLKTTIVESNCPELNIVLDDDALNSALRIADWVKSVGKVAKLVLLQGHDPNILGFEKTMAQITNTDKLDFMGLIRIRLGQYEKN